MGKEVIVEEYNPKWAEDFRKLREIYQNEITDVDVDIQHVGSTSVIGLCAKPIIDIDIIISKMSDFNKVKVHLENLGYRHIGDLGILNREMFKLNNSNLPLHHLYVCLKGAASLNNHLKFRDYLRGNPEAAKKYAELKIALAQKHKNDLDEYCSKKTDFIINSLAKCGLNDSSIRKIKEVNSKYFEGRIEDE